MGKDLFGGFAKAYADARPTYPPALFDALAEVAPSRGLVWDVGTGNGQAALPLAERFALVWATDVSAAQLSQAPYHPRITWREAPAEHSGLADHSVDLVTVAQAYHWFPHDAFHTEVRRVLRPGGALALWSYNLLACTPPLDALIHELYHDLLGPWWEPERRHVENGYASIPWPFHTVSMAAIPMVHRWTFDQLLAYLGTWSALKTYEKASGEDPLREARPRLREAWGAVEHMEITWPLMLRVGRCG